MTNLYINESNATISVSDNYITVVYKDGMFKQIPIETLESINIFGKAHITTPCVVQCLKKGINILYYSKGGVYFGRLGSTEHVNVERQRKQCQIYRTEFALALACKIISAKIHNQRIVMKRYERTSDVNLDEEDKMLKILEGKAMKSSSVEQLMGNEGIAAKYYFQGLAKVVDDEFSFNGRNRRPPRDPFNSMMSLGYSMLMNEIYGKIVSRGLNPYFGFMHADREKHPTLASDLMEEWRAVIVDAMVMSLVNGNEIHTTHFENGLDDPGIYLTGDGMKIFIKKYDKKIKTQAKYLEKVPNPVSFRRAMDIQISNFIDAMENMDCDLYNPIRIR